MNYIKPGQRDAYIEAVKSDGILEKSRQEAGCLMYEFFCPLESANRLLLIERYVDEDAFVIHKAQAHFARLQEIKKEYVLSTTVDMLHP